MIGKPFLILKVDFSCLRPFFIKSHSRFYPPEADLCNVRHSGYTECRTLKKGNSYNRHCSAPLVTCFVGRYNQIYSTILIIHKKLKFYLRKDILFLTAVMSSYFRQIYQEESRQKNSGGGKILPPPLYNTQA